MIDLCAGAGGKALALAAKGARVRAWDERSEALAELERRAARAGADIEITPEPGTADVVLVDAPCSGTGRLRRNPALRWGLEAGAFVDVQRQLLRAARGCVAPGGRLVYATCSLLRAENDHGLEGLERLRETDALASSPRLRRIPLDPVDNRVILLGVCRWHFADTWNLAR